MEVSFDGSRAYSRLAAFASIAATRSSSLAR